MTKEAKDLLDQRKFKSGVRLKKVEVQPVVDRNFASLFGITMNSSIIQNDDNRLTGVLLLEMGNELSKRNPVEIKAHAVMGFT